MQLSRRLLSVASMVTAGNCLADVGTDHGYVPIYLYEKGIIPRAIAMDVNKGPLERAKLHIAQAGLQAVIETRLSDGVAALRPKEADSILIAGMGGPLMVRILSAHLEVSASAKELILQPQSEIAEVRKWLCKQGYEITEEHMVYEEGKYYPMFRAVKNPAAKPLDPLEYRFGRFEVLEEPEVLKAYLRKEIAGRKSIMDDLKTRPGEGAALRLGEISQQVGDLEEMLSRIPEAIFSPSERRYL